jgi:hypothetical protein
MSPGVRRYGTSSFDAALEDNGTWNSSVLYALESASYDEDYDEWDLHGSTSSATTSDLGQLTFDSLRFGDVLDTPGQPIFETVVLDSSSSLPNGVLSTDDDYVELEEDWRILHDDASAIEDEGADCSLDY